MLFFCPVSLYNIENNCSIFCMINASSKKRCPYQKGLEHIKHILISKSLTLSNFYKGIFLCFQKHNYEVDECHHRSFTCKVEKIQLGLELPNNI
jgi:hypothetical protein